MSEYTGPLKPPKVVFEQWAHRMKDFLNPIQQRGFGIAINPKDKGMIVDMLEWLKEQDTWQHGHEVPPVVVTSRVKEGEIRPVDPETLKVLTMAQVNKTRTGFGRYGGLLLPNRDGIHDPWKKGNN